MFSLDCLIMTSRRQDNLYREGKNVVTLSATSKIRKITRTCHDITTFLIHKHVQIQMSFKAHNVLHIHSFLPLYLKSLLCL